jgi:hypothetical protein
MAPPSQELEPPAIPGRFNLSEFDFRYSNRVALGVDDQDRAVKALKGAVGKRLTYRGPASIAASV